MTEEAPQTEAQSIADPEKNPQLAQAALEDINRMMDENRGNPNPLLLVALDQSRRYLEGLIGSDQSTK
jgi:hypothetical protein